MQKLNERLEKSNTTAGKLTEALGYIDALTAELETVKRERDAYMTVCDGKTPEELDEFFELILENQREIEKRILILCKQS